MNHKKMKGIHMSAKKGRPPGTVVERAIRAVRFIESARATRPFSERTLAHALELEQKHAYRWLDALSLIYPISEIEPQRGNGLYNGTRPALYRVEKI